MASYKSSRFLILLGSFDEDVNGDVDDDPSVFLLLNTGNLCTRDYNSSPSNIGLSMSTFGTSSYISSLLKSPFCNGIIQLISYSFITISDKDAFLIFIIKFGSSCI